MERGDFFHEVYKIQEKLGRVMRELQPYALFPLDEYFGGAVRGAAPTRTPTVIEMPVLGWIRPFVKSPDDVLSSRWE